MSHIANEILMDKIRDMEDELVELEGELATLDSEGLLLLAADVYEQIRKVTKQIDELIEYLQ